MNDRTFIGVSAPLALTPAERARAIASGAISLPTTPNRKSRKPHNRSRKGCNKRRKKPLPPSFEGTPKERANCAVELAKTGLYSLCKCATACGYYESASCAIRELIAGSGPLTDLCRKSLTTGKLDAHYSVNTASLRIIRDYYGLPNINGQADGVEELRQFLTKHKKQLAEISMTAWLSADTLRSFVRNKNGMRRATIARVWEAIDEMKLR